MEGWADPILQDPSNYCHWSKNSQVIKKILCDWLVDQTLATLLGEVRSKSIAFALNCFFFKQDKKNPMLKATYINTM